MPHVIIFNMTGKLCLVNFDNTPTLKRLKLLLDTAGEQNKNAAKLHVFSTFKDRAADWLLCVLDSMTL